MKRNQLGKKSILQKGFYMMVVFVSTILVSCNQDYPNLLNEYPEPNTVFPGKNNKVLLITVDGLSGTALAEMTDSEVPTIAAMKRTSLFATKSLADFETSDLAYPTAYTTIFTGVTSNKHGVLSSADQLNPNYPTFIKRIKNKHNNVKASVFSTNQAAFEQLSEDVDQLAYLDSDADAVNSVANHLSGDVSDLVVVNLSNTEKVGSLVSFDIEDNSYRNAIIEFDANLKKIKTALEGRATYNTENWLVIVTSTKGASVASAAYNSAYDDLNRDTFTLFYNKNFNRVPVPVPNLATVPYSGSAPVYNGDINATKAAVIPNDGGKYNFGEGDFTIKFSMRGSGVDKTWPVFLSKSGRIDNTNPGWRLYVSRKNLSIQVAGNSINANWGTNLVVNDGKWHNVTVVFFKEAGRRKVKAFVDNVKSENIQDITGTGSVSTSEPLRIGRNAADTDLPDLQLTHLQLYNNAWSDADVLDAFCKVEVDEYSKHYANLVGYWPADGNARVLVNKAPNAGTNTNFELTNAVGTRQFNDVNELLCPKIQSSFYLLVPNAVDVAPAVYAWMGISAPSTWSLDGKVWPFTFNNLKP